MSSTSALRPRRSVLYMPGSNARALEKARGLAADGLILDLEDSVAPEAKETARRQVRDAVAARSFGRREIAIRVNGIGTRWHGDDVAMAATSGADAIVVPKVQSRAELEGVAALLARQGAPASLGVWAMIETPRAILALASIADTTAGLPSTRLALLLLGLNDLAKETGADLTTDRLPALMWLSSAITVARANGLAILDSAYNDFRDAAGYARECREGRRLGFDGKTLIHPDQIAGANAAFGPAAEDVAWARKVIAAFEQPEAKGKGVIDIDGKMVELLHRDMALKTVAMADAIAALGAPA